MLKFSLGTVLREIKADESDIPKQTFEKDEQQGVGAETDTVIKKNGKLFLANSKEAQAALEEAGIVVDGDIDLKNIEFCKVELQQECLYGSLRIPRLSDICGSKFKVLFLVNRENIVIIDNTSFSEKMIRRIQMKRTKQGHTRERFLYNYLAGIISRDLEVLSRYERTIMKLEDEVHDNRFETFIREMPEIRKTLLILREYYDEIRDLGKELEDDENRFFAKTNLKYFGTISDRADRLMNRTMRLLDYISQVRDTYQQKVSDQQNKNMQFLTVISTIFFPLTLVTGWFGMNFKNMPELEHGYPFVIVGSLIIVAVIIWIFKKKKIM